MIKNILLIVVLVFILPFVTMTPASAGIILWDDFEAGYGGWWTWTPLPYAAYPWTISHNMEMDGTNVYSMRGGKVWGGGDAITYAGDMSLTDYTVQANVKIVEAIHPLAGGGGIAGRLQKIEDNYYFYAFSIYGSGGAVLKRLTNIYADDLAALSAEELDDLGIQIVLGNWYILKMTFQGERIRCYINGILIHDVIDPAYTNGCFGFYNSGAHSHFDNMLATSITPPLVAHWPMNEGLGTIVHDVTGRGHNGTITGDPSEWEWTEGIDGTGLYQHGQAGAILPCVLINGHPDFVFGTESFTLEAWIKLEQEVNPGYGEEIIGSNWAACLSIDMAIRQNKVWFMAGDVWYPGFENYIWSQTQIMEGIWYHLVAVRDAINKKIQIYINGVLDNEEQDFSGNFTVQCYWGLGSMAGIYGNGGSGPFHGVLDEISIYSCALTAEEIYQHYQQFANQPPVANAGPDQSVECTSCYATEVTLDGTGSYDPNDDPLTFQWKNSAGDVVANTAVCNVSLPLGSQTFTLTVDDGRGGTSTDEVIINVADTTPPAVTVILTPDLLWPPNHKLVAITAAVTAADICDPHPVVVLTSITSDEPDNGLGDGDTPNDIQGAQFGTAVYDFQLRAERAGKGDGRDYLITYQVTDASGNRCTVSASVTVPRDRGKLARPTAEFESLIPDSYALMQNHPNPFNPETVIEYQLPTDCWVRLAVYDLLGHELCILVNENVQAGYYSVVWNGRNSSGVLVSSGVYVYRIETGDFSSLRKMTILK